MMKRVLFGVAVVVPAVVMCLATVACKKEDTAATGSAASASVAASASNAMLTALSASAADSATIAPTADPDKLPTPAAHSSAAAAVSTANYKTELDTIEKELNGIK